MGWESLVAIKVLETARPMRHSACGHPSGPAAVAPHKQAGHTTASNDSRRNDRFFLASWGPSTQDRKDARGIAQLLRMASYGSPQFLAPDMAATAREQEITDSDRAAWIATGPEDPTSRSRSRSRLYVHRRARDTGYGPVQSNGMCLLEFVVHWNL